MADVVMILGPVPANGTGPVIDAGHLKGDLALEVFTTGTVSAFSVQLQGSLDGANWVAIGSPVTTATTAAISSGPLARYFQATLSGYSGSGTVSAKLAFAAPSGTGGSGSLPASTVPWGVLTAQGGGTPVWGAPALIDSTGGAWVLTVTTSGSLSTLPVIQDEGGLAILDQDGALMV